MESAIKILVVEDEMIIAANISLQLTNLGYEVTGIVPRGEQAIVHVKDNIPDIVLLDIQLKGELDGIETAQEIRKMGNIPIIYLTANTDDAHFNRAKATNPSAFISKPFKKLDLQHAIELAVNNVMENEIASSTPSKNIETMVLSDRIFVRNHDKMVKVILKDICFIEADRNYCKIFTQKGDYLLVITLKDINEKLPDDLFLRVHRSYIVNLSHVDEVAGSHLMIGKKVIPVSKSFRTELMERLQTL